MEKLQVSKSFRQFVEQTKDESKVSKYLNYYLNGNDIVCRHIKSDSINYLTFRKNGTISYLPNGRELILTNNGEWSREGRQEGKPAKTITQIMRDALKRSLTNRDLEIFSNLYKGRASDLYTIKEAIGEDIRAVYNMEIPFTSCMNGVWNQNKLDLYVSNPDSVMCLYIQVGDRCEARALVWTDEDGNKIMDRVYGGEEFAFMFREYAQEHGWWKKKDDSAGSSPFLDAEGESYYKTFAIPIKCDADRYPYVDTFCYFDDDAMYLTNDEDDGNCTKKLQDTGGNYENLQGVECYQRSGYYHEDDCNWSEYHDAYIHSHDSVWIEDANDYFYEDDGCWEDAIRVSRRNYILVDDCDEVEVVDKDSIEDDIVEIDSLCTYKAYKFGGDYIPVDEATIVRVFVIDGDIQGE